VCGSGGGGVCVYVCVYKFYSPTLDFGAFIL